MNTEEARLHEYAVGSEKNKYSTCICYIYKYGMVFVKRKRTYVAGVSCKSIVACTSRSQNAVETTSTVVTTLQRFTRTSYAFTQE